MLRNTLVLVATTFTAALPAYAHHEAGLAAGSFGLIAFATILVLGAGYGYINNDRD